MLDQVLFSRGWPWGARLGVKIDPELSDDYPVLLLSAPGRRLLSLTPELEEAVEEAGAWLKTDVTIEQVQDFLFGDEAPCQLERAYWMVPGADFIPPQPRHTVVFDPPAEAVKDFEASLPALDWAMGGPILYARTCAVTVGERIAAMASGRLQGGVLDLSYVVHPDFRGRGMGFSALSAMMAAYPKALPLWRTEEANAASMAAAKRMGFVPLIIQDGIMLKDEE